MFRHSAVWKLKELLHSFMCSRTLSFLLKETVEQVKHMMSLMGTFLKQ